MGHSPNGSGHEQSEVSVRMLVLSCVALAVSMAIVFLIVWGIFAYFKGTYRPEQAAAQSQPLPPEPRVEIEPWQQLRGVRAHEEHVLSSYAWVDEKQGTVRIPIDQAMDLLAAKRLPSHNYLEDILAGRKPPMPAKKPAAPKPQGSANAAK